jgi:hypothetical protein
MREIGHMEVQEAEGLSGLKWEPTPLTSSFSGTFV